MHENRVEDALRSVLRREGDDLTLNITAQELERRLALRRRERANRRLSLVAAGIAVVAIGGIVIAGNGWLGSGSAVGGKPATTATAGSAAPDNSAPAPSVSPSAVASASSDGGLGCVAVDPSSVQTPPAVVAGVVPGDSLGYGGTVVAARWNGVDSGTPGTWEGLSSDATAVSVDPRYQVIQLVSDGCMTDVAAEALLTDYTQAPVPSPTPIELAIPRVGGPTRAVEITPPATGGWTIRIRVSFVTTDDSEAWTETLFHVFSLFDAPQLAVGASGGSSIRASATCPNYRLASGASAEDLCGGPYEPMDQDPLVVHNGASVTLALDGTWRIDQAKVTAVQAELVATGQYAPEYSVAFLDKGGLRLSTRVVLDPGSWIVRVSLNGSRGGDTFGAWYDLPVTITR